jgi:LacI family transcriptional regulator
MIMSQIKLRTTISDVATAAGVSVPTVSKVLNGRTGVGAETRDQVLATLEQLGYRRRGIERRQLVGLVDLVIPDISSLWANQLLQGAVEEASAANVGLVVTSSHGQSFGNKHWFQQISSRRTDGIIFVVSQLHPGAEAQLHRLNMPYVLVDPVGGADPAMPTVAASNWTGGLSAVEHLLELGHTRIGIITGPLSTVCFQDRLDGYRTALHRAGISETDDLVRSETFDVAGGRKGASSLLSMSNPPTAIVAGTDSQAYGVYQEAAAKGLSVPNDLSVVGFDDVELCQWISPPLTTVHQPVADMAKASVRMVLDISRQGRLPSPRIEFATSLVVRSSTAHPRRGSHQ